MPRKCRTKRLCEFAQAQPKFFRHRLEIGFEGFACPVNFGLKPGGNLGEEPTGVRVQQRCGLFRHRQRAVLEQERGAIGQFVQILRPELERGHGLFEQSDVRFGPDARRGEFRQMGIVRLPNIEAVEILQLLDVEAGRALADTASGGVDFIM